MTTAGAGRFFTVGHSTRTLALSKGRNSARFSSSPRRRHSRASASLQPNGADPLFRHHTPIQGKETRAHGLAGTAEVRPEPPRLFTVGHSTRTLDELVELLQEHGITQLVDVRHFPHSRRNPQFNREALTLQLPERGLSYIWLGEELGGLRAGGYERYMETPGFQAGIEHLRQLCTGTVTAVMCAEIVWFRCHRRFIARRMRALGCRVTHLVQSGRPGYEELEPA